MKIKPLRKDLKDYLQKHQLEKKWQKILKYLQDNLSHPSLNLELLKPHWRGIYSFRVNRKYRAIFFITPKKEIEVFQITNHYKK